MREYGAMETGSDTLQPGDTVIVVAVQYERVEADRLSRGMCEGQGLVLDVKMKLDRATLPPCVELQRL